LLTGISAVPFHCRKRVAEKASATRSRQFHSTAENGSTGKKLSELKPRAFPPHPPPLRVAVKSCKPRKPSGPPPYGRSSGQAARRGFPRQACVKAQCQSMRPRFLAPLCRRLCFLSWLLSQTLYQAKAQASPQAISVSSLNGICRCR